MINLLDVLPEYVLYWMVQKGTERTLRQNEALLTEGEKNDSLFIVLDGLFGARMAGQTKALEHFGAGSVLGETSYFTDGVVTATVLAEEPSLVLEISRSLLGSKLEHDSTYASDFYRALVKTVADRLVRTTAKLYASEVALLMDYRRDPLVQRAQHEIDAFKELMVQLDKEGIKNGTITEESYQRLATHAGRISVVCHEVMGEQSPLGEGIKNQLGARLQHEMLPYILATETADRFYSKPRGYAGDYLAIQNIYRNIPGGTGRLGPVIDRMFLETPPSRAVRNRRKLLAEEILATVNSRGGGVVKVLCMASGPATEVFDAFSQLEEKSRLQVTLMDIDLQSLAMVDEIRTKQKLTNQIRLINENLIALYLGRSKTKIELQDMIYSIGLIDYLNDKLVLKLLQYAHDNLASGGRIILGNFHPRNPAKEFMEHVLEWTLIHRTEDDMHRLFQQSAFRRPCTKIRFEQEGVNLFAECVKE